MKVMVAVLLVTLTGGMVLAKTINGTANDDYLEGTPQADNISGRAGDDQHPRSSCLGRLIRSPLGALPPRRW